MSRSLAIFTPKWTATTRDHFAEKRHLQHYETSTLILVLHSCKNYLRGLPRKVVDVLKPDIEASVRSIIDELYRRDIDLPVKGNEHIITDLNQLAHAIIGATSELRDPEFRKRVNAVHVRCFVLMDEALKVNEKSLKDFNIE